MMKRKNIIFIFTLIATILLVACENEKDNDNHETTDSRKFTQEMITELEEEVKGGTHNLAVYISVENRYNVSAGNYEVTDCELTDEYTFAVYGKIKIQDNNNIKDKNIIVTYQLVDGEPNIASVVLK